ncbi:MAG: hypothetical protein ABR606_16450 [Vicinamibacterales bacterium]
MPTILVLVVLCTLVAPSVTVGDPAVSWRDGGPRLRPNDSRVSTLLRAGLDRSPTLRALVDRIEEGQVIVYLEMQPRLRARMSGCLTWLAAAGSFRFVRASISPHLTVDQQIASIAHELHHAVEIARNPRIASEATMLAFYRRTGDQRVATLNSWDTPGARAVGATVRRELAAVAGRIAADAVGAISPGEWHAFYRNERLRLGLPDLATRF